MFKSHRIAGPLSASVALLLALSACSSASDTQNSATSASSTGVSANAAASAEQANGKLPLGLSDDNKAGEKRPRSKIKEVAKGATVNPDGSWTYTKSDGTKMTTKADGTWSITNEKEGTRSTLNPDGSWEQNINSDLMQRHVRVNADGTWNMDDRKVGRFETHADGSWKKSQGTSESIGNADGTATIKDSAGKRDLPRQQWPAPPPVPTLAVSDEGVGGESVLPLQPRKAITTGTKVIYVVPGSEEDQRATAEQEGLLLTDDNQAGKPRPRPTHKAPEYVTVSEDGSWVEKNPDGTITTVHADGTWEQSNTAGDTAALHADGSWDEYFAARDESVHVDPDGSWSWDYKGGEDELVKGEHKITVKADGSWRNKSESFTTYGTADGKVFQEAPEKRELTKGDAPKGIPYIPIPQSPNGPGGGGVVPLKARAALKAGQKVTS